MLCRVAGEASFERTREGAALKLLHQSVALSPLASRSRATFRNTFQTEKKIASNSSCPKGGRVGRMACRITELRL